jgi:hypothetical protein
MSYKSENELNPKNSVWKQLIACLLLWTLLTAVFPTAFSAQKLSTPEGLVYCPLSKKLQPINLPKKKKETEPFDELCASKRTKDFLYQEIVLKTPWRVFTLDANGYEKLAFDYLANGKAALYKLPFTPNAPFKALVERVTPGVVSNNHGEHRLVLKNAVAGAFSPNLKPRPPTGEIIFPSFVSQTYRSAPLSRRLAPRAPPLS